MINSLRHPWFPPVPDVHAFPPHPERIWDLIFQTVMWSNTMDKQENYIYRSSRRAGGSWDAIKTRRSLLKTADVFTLLSSNILTLTYSVSFFSCASREPDGPSLSLKSQHLLRYSGLWQHNTYIYVFIRLLHHLPYAQVAPEGPLPRFPPVDKNKNKLIRSRTLSKEVIVLNC